MDAFTTNQQLPHVVIIGGGFGGLDTARSLAKAPVHITLIDRNNHHVFQPLLYQVATAGLSPADIAAPIRHILSRQRNTEVIMAEVSGVDTDRKMVKMGDRELKYDYLVLATGARHSYFGKDDWEENAPGLKSLLDATTIRRKVLTAFEKAETETDPLKQRALLTFVIVGAGPTGVEMAGAIWELAKRALASDFRHIDPKSARIVLIEAGPRILAAFPEDLSQKAQDFLHRHGIEIMLHSPVQEVDDNGVLVGFERIDSATVIWAAGVQASPAGKWLGAETDRARRTRVNPDLSVLDRENVFVIGDAAILEQNGQQLPGVAPVAMQQGRYVGNLIRRRVMRLEAPPPFHYINKGNLATVGRRFAIVHIGRLKLSGYLAWLFWLALHVFFLIGFRNRAIVMLQWTWAYLTYERGARLITPTIADEERQSSPRFALPNALRRDETRPPVSELAPEKEKVSV